MRVPAGALAPRPLGRSAPSLTAPWRLRLAEGEGVGSPFAVLRAAGEGVRVSADLLALIAGAEGRAPAEARVTTLCSLLPGPGKPEGAGCAQAGVRMRVYCVRVCMYVCVCVHRAPPWICAVLEPIRPSWGKFPACRPLQKFHPRRKTLVLTFPLSRQTSSRLQALQEA